MGISQQKHAGGMRKHKGGAMTRGTLILLSVLLLLSLAGCVPTDSKSGTESQSASPAAATPDYAQEEAAIAKASTVDELNALLDQYYQDGKYPVALLAAEKILELDPANEEVYTLKAQLWILTIQDAYDSLNAMLEQDIGKVSDPASYRESVTQMYEQAQLQLTMPFTSDYVSPDEINTVGNTGGNLNGGWTNDNYSVSWDSVLAAQGDWVYYAEYGENFALYKMRNNGQARQLICTDSVCGLNVIGDWIYYRNISDGDSLYKIRTDGSMKTKLSEDACQKICVSGDWIYYTSANEGYTIYKIRTDGSERTQLNAQANSMFIDGDWLYYSTTDNYMNLNRMSLDGSETQSVLKDQWNINAQICDGWLYYLTDIKGMVLMKARPDGSEQTEIWRFAGKIGYFTIAENKLFVSVRNDESRLETIYAFDLDTMEQVLQLEDKASGAICTDAQGEVILSSSFDNNAWYRINWDGKAIEPAAQE